MSKIAIMGAAGRMGRSLVAATVASKQAEMSLGVVRPGSSLVGVDLGELAGLEPIGVFAADNLEQRMDDFDTLIDFSSPELSLANVELCHKAGKKVVIGTTGFSESEKNHLIALSRDIPIVFSYNMSVGVNLCFKLAEVAARVMAAEEADVEIVETHHRFKKDSPSGTAVRLGEVIADVLGYDLNTDAAHGRKGLVGERQKQEIGFHAVRAGDVIGDHSAIFASLGERVEITHKASNRSIYAKGAVRAALWLNDKPVGFYSMQDVLGLN